MRKHLLATAVALACCAASVQAAQVTLYGIVDMGIEAYNDGDRTTARVSSGLREGSRWGMMGSEEIGAGTEVFFRLESTLLADTGQKDQNRLFDRETVLGVRSDYGALSFGRQYSPHFLTMAMTDPMGMGMSSAGGYYGCPAFEGTINGFANDETTRFDNSINYETPVWNGLMFQLYAALGEESMASNGVGTSPSKTRGNVYSIGARYNRDNLQILASYLRINTRQSGFENWDNYYALGVSYDLGYTKPSLLFVHRDAMDTANAGASPVANPDLYMLQLAAATPLYGGTLITNIAALKNNSLKDGDAWSWGVRYDYPLSKRVTTYGGVTGILNGKASQYNIGGGGSSSPGMPVKFGDDPWVTYMGLAIHF